jgi:hypothetical protein
VDAPSGAAGAVVPDAAVPDVAVPDADDRADPGNRPGAARRGRVRFSCQTWEISCSSLSSCR